METTTSHLAEGGEENCVKPYSKRHTVDGWDGKGIE
jgi:hypothetical protein